MWFRKKKSLSKSKGGADLRGLALSFRASDIGLARVEGGPKAFGVLMETGHPKAVATLACFADGSTSLYFSNGGGVIGAGEHPSVRSAATAFIAIVETLLAKFAASTDSAYPPIGSTKFFVHTFDGLLTAMTEDAALANRQHALFPVFFAGHGVITAIRKLGLV